MKILILKILFLVVPVMMLTGCSDHEDGPAPECPRAVLVYMAANNSLGAAHYDTDDLNEMAIAARQGDFGHSRLFVYHHARNAAPVLKEITAYGERIVATYDKSASSVSSARMSRVIDDFRRYAPASRYGIILWSHGSGWIENGMEQSARPNARSEGEMIPLSFGDDGGRYMNVTTLATTLRGKGFDYIYFDCCYMAGVEVAYELRDCASRIVASSTELPASGMPYDETLRYLLKADADLAGAARATFDFYNAMSGQNRTCTISVIDTAGLEALAEATRAVYEANNVTSDGFAPQQFMTYKCYLFDFGQYVGDLASQHPGLKAGFDNALDNTVIFKASTPRIWNVLPLTHHSGLSTRIPDYSDDDSYNYDNLQWASDVASALSR